MTFLRQVHAKSPLSPNIIIVDPLIGVPVPPVEVNTDIITTIRDKAQSIAVYINTQFDKKFSGNEVIMFFALILILGVYLAVFHNWGASKVTATNGYYAPYRGY